MSKQDLKDYLKKEINRLKYLTDGLAVVEAYEQAESKLKALGSKIASAEKELGKRDGLVQKAKDQAAELKEAALRKLAEADETLETTKQLCTQKVEEAKSQADSIVRAANTEATEVAKEKAELVGKVKEKQKELQELSAKIKKAHDELEAIRRKVA